jgi:putative heme iron utilization protein
MSDQRSDGPATTARRLMRAQDRATLATSLDGWPYASLVLVAADHDATPLLLISDLAEHTKNAKRDPRASLLFDGTYGLDDPLTGARVTVLGELAPDDDPARLARFVGRHPSAEGYAGFKDFRLYRLGVTRGHIVAGFGRIHWVPAADLLYDTAAATPLAEAEAAILAHMNADHADTVDLYARRLLGLAGSGWRLTGVDPEGADLRRGGAVGRLDFARPVADAEGARAELVRLAKAARQGG